MNKFGNEISRRGFIGTMTGAAAMTLIGLDRKAKAGDSPGSDLITDYTGRLCFNENPLGPSQAAIEAIRGQADMAHRYPDWFAESLISRLASQYDVSESKIICGSGATEILRLCAQGLCGPGTNVVSPNPSYGQFTADAELLGSSVRYVELDSEYRVDLEELRDRVDDNTVAVCITNPNNPTATIIDDGELEAFVDSLPEHVATIIDEAYFEYISDQNYRSAIDMVRAEKKVAVVKTFSKVHGLAGARIGFVIGHPSIIGSMSPYRMISTVSRSSLEAAKASLDQQQHVDDTVSLANFNKEYCFGEFDRLGLQYIPSQASFFMVDVGQNADWVRSQLAERGIYVRTGWGMPDHLRVSTGLVLEMTDFMTALEDILERVNIGDAPPLPSMTELYQAYPNPFNSSTQIKIHLSSSTKTRLEIYDIRGSLVKRLADTTMGPGEYAFTWDGSNQQNRSVASGSYFYRLIAGDDVITRRMLLLK